LKAIASDFGGVGVSTATCDIRFSLQDEYAGLSRVGKLADRGVSNQAVTISGYATVSEKNITSQEFIDACATRSAPA